MLVCVFLSEFAQPRQTRPPIEPTECRCVRDELRSAAHNQRSRLQVHLKLNLIIVYRQHVLNKRRLGELRNSTKTRRLMKVIISGATCRGYAAYIKVRSGVTVGGQAKKHPAISILANKWRLQVCLPK